MTEYRIRSTGEIVTDLAKTFPNTSIPQPISEESLDFLGVDVVFEGPHATGGSVYQYSVRDGVEQKSDGKWYTKYVLGPKFDKPEEQAAYEKAKDEEQAARVRAERNERLSKCDWTQVADAPVDDLAWAAYRQELRDVPNQAGFPWQVVWPNEP
jgi:hypothetical protein